MKSVLILCCLYCLQVYAADPTGDSKLFKAYEVHSKSDTNWSSTDLPIATTKAGWNEQVIQAHLGEVVYCNHYQRSTLEDYLITGMNSGHIPDETFSDKQFAAKLSQVSVGFQKVVTQDCNNQASKNINELPGHLGELCRKSCREKFPTSMLSSDKSQKSCIKLCSGYAEQINIQQIRDIASEGIELYKKSLSQVTKPCDGSVDNSSKSTFSDKNTTKILEYLNSNAVLPK